MTRKPVTVFGLIATLGVLTLLGLTSRRPAANAAPPAKPPASTAAQPSATFADLLSGKLYPNTIKRDELAPFYHFITIIDAQGNPAQCATKGETQTLGGETFLVAYRLPDALPAPAAGPAPPLPDARLILVNMHSIEAIGGIRDTEAALPPAVPPPAPVGATGATTNGPATLVP